MAQVATPQGGAISRAQLIACGVTRMTVSRWTADAYLHPYLPGVYTVGHRNLSVEGRLHAALLYAGPDAALSHTTAAWWWQLIDSAPVVIHLRTPHRTRSQRGLKVHGRREPERTAHRGFPVTTVPQTLLDYASSATVRQTRRALAEADYHRVLDPQDINRVLRRGAPGSTTLRRALDRHQPSLAHARTELEQVFFELCERAKLPLPRLNIEVAGLTVDALWPEQKVIVELDGGPGHSTTVQMYRDRDRDLTLRALGYVVLRYTWWQLTETPKAVAHDLEQQLNRFVTSA